MQTDALYVGASVRVQIPEINRKHGAALEHPDGGTGLVKNFCGRAGVATVHLDRPFRIDRGDHTETVVDLPVHTALLVADEPQLTD